MKIPKMTDQEIINKINEVLVSEFEADPTEIKPEAPLLQTMQIDSLYLVDVVVLIDKNFGIILTETDFTELKTFQTFYDLIIRKIREKETSEK